MRGKHSVRTRTSRRLDHFSWAILHNAPAVEPQMNQIKKETMQHVRNPRHCWFVHAAVCPCKLAQHCTAISRCPFWTLCRKPNCELHNCRPSDRREGTGTHALTEASGPSDGLGCHPPQPAGCGRCSTSAGKQILNISVRFMLTAELPLRPLRLTKAPTAVQLS